MQCGIKAFQGELAQVSACRSARGRRRMDRSCTRTYGYLPRLRFPVGDFFHVSCRRDSAGGPTSSLPDDEKFRIYIRIVRLLLEDEDSVQAETYYNRAALLSNSTTERETQLQFKLCQARISDYARKFLEAAMRYHELSWAADIDEEERRELLYVDISTLSSNSFILHIRSSAVTCAVLAPAGPNRSRVLASLYRDERSCDLPTYNILSKMFLDHILRPAEIHSFEQTLKPHQLAQIAISSNDRLASTVNDEEPAEPSSSKRTGPSTVLDRAVMEHNLLASSKIYNNITFRGLGALLDLSPGAAETMARKMIEQGRLKGSIDQVDKLIWFDGGKEEDDAQGKAGGLGDVVQTTEDTGAPFTRRWDMQIRTTAANVSIHCQENLFISSICRWKPLFNIWLRRA